MKRRNIVWFVILMFFFTNLFFLSKANPIYSDEKAEYVLICEDQYLESTKVWTSFLKEGLGKTVSIYLASEIFKSSDPNEIERCKQLKSFIKEIYDSRDVSYILFVGSQFPYMKLYPDGQNSKFLKVPYIYSDLFFSDLTSEWDFDNDGIYGEIEDDRIKFNPEIMIGRLPFSSPREIENYFQRIIDLYTRKRNNNVLFTASFQQFEHAISNELIKEIDNANFCETIIKNIEKSYNCYRLYEASGIQSSKWIHKADGCLSKSSINTYLANINPSIACFNLKGNTKSLVKTYWVKDINKNGLAESEEIKDEIVFDGTSVSEIKNKQTFFFSMQSPSLWQEGADNLSIDVLSNTGAIFGGNSIDVSLIELGNEINFEIFSHWINQVANKIEIGNALNDTISKYYEIYKNTNYDNKLKSISVLYSLSFIGDPMLSLGDRNILKSNKYSNGDELINPVKTDSPSEPRVIKSREVLPNPPPLEKVEINRKVFSEDPIEFSRRHDGNGFYCTKDGGIVIASSLPVRKGSRFCVSKYKSDGSKEWEFIPNMKSEGEKSETGLGAAFDVIERREFEGYIAVGFLEQQDYSGSKDKDVCIIVIDKDGRELYRSKYGTLSENKCRGHCDDSALNIIPLRNGEYIVSGYQMSDGLNYSLYIATLYPNGGVKNQYNRAVIINNLGEQLYSGPQPYTRIKQLDENYILMYVEKYNTLILTNNNFEEAIMKVFFPFDKYSFPDMVYLSAKDNRIPPELKGRMIFCYENSLFTLEASGEQDKEGKITPIKSFPSCFECLNVFKQDDGIYLLCKANVNDFYLFKFDFNMNFLWKINLLETLLPKSYAPFYSSYFFDSFSPKLNILDNKLKLNQLLVNLMKNGKNIEEFVLIDCIFETPYELRKPKLQVAAKSYYSLSPILIESKISFSFRLSNIGGGKIDVQLSQDSTDTIIEEYPQKLSCSQSENCLILIDSSNYKVGKYEKSIEITNKNNPSDSYSLRILFEIRDLEPMLEISTDLIDFGSINEGEIIEKTLVFSNKGGGVINLKLVSGQDWITVDPKEVNIGKKEERLIKVIAQFKEELIGEIESFINVYSKDEILKLIKIKIYFSHPKPIISIFSDDKNFNPDLNFNFGNVNINDLIKGSFVIKNVGTGALVGSIVNVNKILDLKSSESFNLKENESIEVSFIIDCSTLKPDIYNISISIENNDQNKEIYFHWIALPPLPEIEPKLLNIDKIIQNTAVEYTVQVKNIKGNLKMLVSTNTFWISLPEQEIIVKHDQVYNFKINTNGLPVGKHIGEIYFSFVFTPSDSNYIDLYEFKLPIEINVESDKLVIELWIGKNKALVNGIPKSIDSADSSVVPLIVNNITMVPLRFVGESLGAIVQWNNSDQSVYLNFVQRKLEIKLFVGKKYAYINGKQYQLQTPPIIIKSRVFIPIRFVSEAIGANVEWDGKQ